MLIDRQIYRYMYCFTQLTCIFTCCSSSSSSIRFCLSVFECHACVLPRSAVCPFRDCLVSLHWLLCTAIRSWLWRFVGGGASSLLSLTPVLCCTHWEWLNHYCLSFFFSAHETQREKKERGRLIYQNQSILIRFHTVVTKVYTQNVSVPCNMPSRSLKAKVAFYSPVICCGLEQQ